MNQPDEGNYLNQQLTSWTQVYRAHADTGAEAQMARRALLDRYSGVVLRYLHGALRDTDSAHEVYQDFALRFLRGDFHRASPARGRFRDYLKTALIRLVNRHRQRQQTDPPPLTVDVCDPTPTDVDVNEQAWLRSWRSELLARAWQALERLEQKTQRPHYQVMRLVADHEELSHEQRAEILSARLGRPINEVAYRQMLARARQLLRTLLRNEVLQTLDHPTPEALEDELAELGLLRYCR